MAVARGISIAIVPTAHEDYLRLECSGMFTVESAFAAYERAFALAAEAGRPAVLVDIRTLSGREPTMAERYQWAVRIAELQAEYKPRILVALVGNEPLVHPERFGEIVAARHGAMARTFTDATQALEWLVGKPGGP